MIVDTSASAFQVEDDFNGMLNHFQPIKCHRIICNLYGRFCAKTLDFGHELLSDHLNWSIICLLTINNEFDLFVSVASTGVPCGINGTKVDSVVPPHHLIKDQISFCRKRRK